MTDTNEFWEVRRTETWRLRRDEYATPCAAEDATKRGDAGEPDSVTVTAGPDIAALLREHSSGVRDAIAGRISLLRDHLGMGNDADVQATIKGLQAVMDAVPEAARA